MSTMADTPKAGRGEWSALLEQLTKEHEGHHTTIELLDPQYGDEPQAERLPFAYAGYDPRDDVVIVAVGGNSSRYPVVLRHMVWHPEQVDIAGNAFRVIEKDGTTTLVAFYPDATS
jgi:Family of unknown function (DUF5335)